MKTLPLVLFAVSLWCGQRALALTPDRLAGVYIGTSVITNDDDAPFEARSTVKIKATGEIQVLDNTGDTLSGFFGDSHFASKHLINGTTSLGEFTMFVDLKGSTLTINVLVHADNGGIRRETITAVLQKKR